MTPPGPPSGWVLAGVVVGSAIGAGLMWWWLTQRSGGAAGQPTIRETRIKRDEQGFVEATQTVEFPVSGVGNGNLPQLNSPEPSDGE